MASTDDQDRLIAQRRQEGRRDEAQRIAEERAARLEQAELNILTSNFQSNVGGNLVNLITKYNPQLQDAGNLELGYGQSECRITYTKLGGDGHCDTAAMKFSLQADGQVSITSKFGQADTKRWDELTYAVLDQKLRDFLAAALA